MTGRERVITFTCDPANWCLRLRTCLLFAASISALAMSTYTILVANSRSQLRLHDFEGRWRKDRHRSSYIRTGAKSPLTASGDGWQDVRITVFDKYNMANVEFDFGTTVKENATFALDSSYSIMCVLNPVTHCLACGGIETSDRTDLCLYEGELRLIHTEAKYAYHERPKENEWMHVSLIFTRA